MPYVPDPTDAAAPLDTEIARTAAAEFRALKAYLQGTVLPPSLANFVLKAGDTMTGALVILDDVTAEDAIFDSINASVAAALPDGATVGSQLIGFRRFIPTFDTFGNFIPSDSGKCRFATGASQFVNGMTQGDTVTVINTTGAPQALTLSGCTGMLAGTISVGPWTLASPGICTAVYTSGSTFILSGIGVS